MSSSLAPSLHKPKTAVCVNFFRNIDDPCQKIRTRYPVEQRIDIDVGLVANIPDRDLHIYSESHILASHVVIRDQCDHFLR
ncbi:21246_t:CDS:2 [Rhizophagus irregularis]|nr:21246_t:CDS:2 [Rhizophagus irregularis]